MNYLTSHPAGKPTTEPAAREPSLPNVEVLKTSHVEEFVELLECTGKGAYPLAKRCLIYGGGRYTTKSVIDLNFQCE